MVGSRVIVIALLASLLAWPASASLLESATGGTIAYQFDGEGHHDAPDECEAAATAWSLPTTGSTDGLLLPPDDAADAFLLDVAPGQVGSRLTVAMSETSGAVDLDLLVLAPGCGSTVLDPLNQPFPFPQPPAPASTQAQHSLGRNEAPFHCGDFWGFVVTDLDGASAPATLHAAWTDGSEATVPLAYANRHWAAYVTDVPQDFSLTGAWINLPSSWSGRFVLALAPCGAVDGGAVYGEPAVLGDDLLAFTPIRAGPHVVLVGLAPPEPPEPPQPPKSIPLSCHMCIDGTDEAAEKAGYVVSSDQKNP